MTNSSANDKKWIVKSGAVISGPFSKAEIALDLKSRKLTLIDEIRSPENRWSFIREQTQFSDVIQDLKNHSPQGKEDTGSTFIGTETITEGPEEATLTPVTLVMAEVLETRPAIEAKPNKSAAPPAFASSQDPRIKRDMAPEKKHTALAIWLTILVALLGLWAYQFLSGRDSTKILGYDDYIFLAKSNRAIGNFEKSLEFFRRAESFKHLDVAHQIQMIPLLMVVENQNVQARQMLEVLQSLPDLNEKSKSEVEKQLALSYLREGRLDEAQRRYSEIIKKEPTNEAAQINLVQISILQGQFQEAFKELTLLIQSGFKDPLIILFRLLMTYRVVEDPIKLESAKADLKRLLAQNQSYRLEMLFLLAAIQKKMKQDLDAADTIKNLLEQDPDLTALHVQDFMVHREVVEWTYLGNICDILVQQSPGSASTIGLSAFCSYQKKDLKSASDKIEKARNQFSNDKILTGQQAFFFYKADRKKEAKAILSLPGAIDNDLSRIVKAHICVDEKDFACAENSWKAIQQNDPKNLAAFAGLSEVALESGQKEAARVSLKQGLLISSNYRPFLELKEKIDED
ncbi:MAG: tetratricopeptide repeat protein [Pseudobdellovibrionaceae bacterium]